MKQVNLQNIQEIADKIRKILAPGIIIILSGPMGVGKTTLISHILPEYEVHSPSFLHALLYGDNFAHIDAYTLKSKEAFLALDLVQMLEKRCVIIEWGELFIDTIKNFDAQFLEIELSYGKKENERFIFIKNSDILNQ